MVTWSIVLDQFSALSDRIEHPVRSSERGIRVIYGHSTSRLCNRD
jgi:hypothetical protein